MKAITLTQPWAALVALGAKRVETRSWSTSYRGPLAIHAAKGFPDEAILTCREGVAERIAWMAKALRSTARRCLRWWGEVRGWDDDRRVW